MVVKSATGGRKICEAKRENKEPKRENSDAKRENSEPPCEARLVPEREKHGPREDCL